MQITNECPVCGSCEIERLRRFVFGFPGEDVKEHLDDIAYTRLWILFERILKHRTDVIFHAMLCQRCGLIFTNPRFSEEDIHAKYRTINELGSVKDRLEKHPASNLEVRANRVHNLIQKCIPQPLDTKPRILDYGGASGYNLIPFMESFECGLLDYEEWALPEGIEYLGNDLSDLAASDQFDVILLLHTLEHILTPTEFLTALSNHLKPDGFIYIEVPLGCFREWQAIREPLTHMNFFSEQSLFRCCTLSGLDIVHLDTSYQWVVHSKNWCLNIVGARKGYERGELSRNALSTRNQMNRLRYYLPYLLKWKSVLGGIERKLRA